MTNQEQSPQSSHTLQAIYAIDTIVLMVQDIVTLNPK